MSLSLVLTTQPKNSNPVFEVSADRCLITGITVQNARFLHSQHPGFEDKREKVRVRASVRVSVCVCVCV